MDLNAIKKAASVKALEMGKNAMESETVKNGVKKAMENETVKRKVKEAMQSETVKNEVKKALIESAKKDPKAAMKFMMGSMKK